MRFIRRTKNEKNTPKWGLRYNGCIFRKGGAKMETEGKVPIYIHVVYT